MNLSIESIEVGETLYDVRSDRTHEVRVIRIDAAGVWVSWNGGPTLVALPQYLEGLKRATKRWKPKLRPKAASATP